METAKLTQEEKELCEQLGAYDISAVCRKYNSAYFDDAADTDTALFTCRLTNKVVRATFGKSDYIIFMTNQLTDLKKYCGDRMTVTSAQYPEVAVQMYNCSKGSSLPQVLYFFHQLKAGRYEVFGDLDTMRLMECYQKHLAEMEKRRTRFEESVDRAAERKGAGASGRRCSTPEEIVAAWNAHDNPMRASLDGKGGVVWTGPGFVKTV